MAKTPIGRRAGINVRRQLHTVRLNAALINTGTAVIAGGIIVSASFAYVLQTWDLLRTGAWAWGLGAGGLVLGVKVLLDSFDSSEDSILWREVLTKAFGDGMRMDSDVARQARLAIEFRTRLAAAEARADRDARRLVSVYLPYLDTWLDRIVELARRMASQRGEASFQSGLATRARQRRNEIASKIGQATDAALARQLLQTASGLDAQIGAAEGYARSVETGYLRLEKAVGAFGAVCTELVLILSENRSSSSSSGLTDLIKYESDDLGRQLVAINQIEPPPPNAQPELPTHFPPKEKLNFPPTA